MERVGSPGRAAVDIELVEDVAQEVEAGALHIRLRDEGEQLPGARVDTAVGNRAGRELRVGERIADGRGAEIAGADGERRHVEIRRPARALAQTFIAQREKRAVADNRAVQGSAKFIAVDLRLGQAGGEEIFGGEGAVAVILVQRQMQAVAAGAGNHLDGVGALVLDTDRALAGFPQEGSEQFWNDRLTRVQVVKGDFLCLPGR
jgi:hypothetical protein